MEKWAGSPHPKWGQSAICSPWCYGGVLGFPAVLWGPPTPNPARVARGDPYFILKNGLVFPMCMWKCGGPALCSQVRLQRLNEPKYSKKPCHFTIPPNKGFKIAAFSFKKTSLLGPRRSAYSQFVCCRPYFVAGILFGGSGHTTRKSAARWQKGKVRFC